MECPNCGAQVSDDASNCGKCGTKLEQQKPSAKEKEVKEKKNTNKLQIAVIVLAVIFVIGIITFIIINVSITSYKNVAKKYDMAVKNGDIDKAYECLDVEDSIFLTKEAYYVKASVIGDVAEGTDIADIVQKIGKKGYDFIVSRFAKMDYTVLDANQEGDEAVVTFQLNSRYDKLKFLSQSETIRLKKSSHNHMGIFSNWKVVDDTIIAENITLKVPSCKKAYIDGIEIPSDYLTKEENGLMIYTIPGLFTGNHVCSVTNDEATYKNYNITAGKSNTEIAVRDVTLEEDQQRNVINAANEALRAVIEAEVRGAQFDEVASYFAPEYARIEKELYNTDKANFYSPETQSGITSVEISNVKGSIYNESFTDDTLEVSVKLDYTDSNKGKVNTYILGVFEGADENNQVTQVMRLQYVDGKWLVSSFGDNRIVNNQWFFGNTLEGLFGK